MSVLPTRKRGRPVLLGEKLDETIQMYIRKSRESGGAVSFAAISALSIYLILRG